MTCDCISRMNTVLPMRYDFALTGVKEGTDNELLHKLTVIECGRCKRRFYVGRWETLTEFDPSVADLMLRQHFALIEEGIAPLPPLGGDRERLRAAIRVVEAHSPGRYSAHGFWDYQLLTDEEHPPEGCEACAGMGRGKTGGS